MKSSEMEMEMEMEIWLGRSTAFDCTSTPPRSITLAETIVIGSPRMGPLTDHPGNKADSNDNM